MYIQKIEIINYKSFGQSDEIEISKGFNIVIGQNNVGKTALLEGLSMKFIDRPHRSPKTVPRRKSDFPQQSSVTVSFVIEPNELIELVNTRIGPFKISTDSASPEAMTTVLSNLFKSPITITCSYSQGKIHQARIDGAPNRHPDLRAFRFTFTGEGTLHLNNPANADNNRESELLEHKLSELCAGQIYLFNAQRVVPETNSSTSDLVLKSDASNLHQVLHTLTANSHRFRRFEELVRQVFPVIRQITTPVLPDLNTTQTKIWTFDPSLERDDLAISVQEAGTGIVQVLAILFVLVTSEEPHVLLIDEPQSFLHPGAIRKLFRILRDHQQHQYIVTTHSPIALTAACPDRIMLVTYVEGESCIKQIEQSKPGGLAEVISELGSKFGDVFGAEKVLWVEGPTEEMAFSSLIKAVPNLPISDIVIAAVMAPGDFEGKHGSKVIQIYNRLSSGPGLLPPAVGFIFDSELKTETEIKELKKRCGNRVWFLPRRMYENYLLNPEAIAELANNIGGFAYDIDTGAAKSITSDDVHTWIEDHRWDSQFVKDSPLTLTQEDQRTEEQWLRYGDAAKLLQVMFSQLSGQRVSYDKVQHGRYLTNWILGHADYEFDDLMRLLVEALGVESD